MKETKIVELVIADDSQELAIDAISLVSSPAIEQDFVFFGKEKNNLTFAKVDEEKRMLVSPALIPNKQIFRYDPNTDSEYYVYFSPDTVRKASELYLKHNNHHKATHEHNERVSGVLTVESWIIEDPKMDKSTLYGFSLPKGTWMVKLSISNEDLWSKIKAGELKGLSIEGYFTNKFEQMQKKQPTTEQILSALNELIKENKTELKAEKVELGLVDDIEKLVNSFKDVAKEESDVVTRIAKAISDYKPVVSNAKKLITKSSSIISKVEQQAKELGVKTKDIAKFDVLKNFTESAEKIEGRYKRSLKAL